MEPMQFRLAEIRVNENRSPERLVEYLQFDHDRRQGKPFHLFAVAEIHSSLYLYERLLDALHSALSQAKTFVSGMDGDPMVRFEKVVQRLNDALVRAVQAESGTIQWERVNLYVFQLADGHLCFSGIGNLSNMFLQRQEDGHVRPFDLLGSLEQPETIDPTKPLSAIICGNMNVGDLLFIGTQNFQTQREALEISRTLQEHPPVAAATELQQRLIDLRSDERYFGLVIAGVAMTPAKPSTQSQPAAQEPFIASASIEEPDEALAASVQSVQEFYATEQATDQVLNNESAGPSFRERFEAIKARFNKSSGPDFPSFASPVLLSGLRSMHAGYTKTLLDKNRSVLVGIAVLIAIVGGGGLWIHSIRTKQAEQKLWSTVYDQAVDGKNKAEAALVYGDEDRARAQYTYAINQLSQLDQKTKDRAQARTTLEKELTDIRTRLRRESVVANPIVVAELKEQNTNATPTGLVVQGGKAYTIDRASNRIFVVTIGDSSIKTIAGPDETTLETLGNGRTAPILRGANGGFYTIQNDKLTALASTVSKTSSTVALTTYGQRVYTVDPNQGTIWRWNASASALNGESSYVKTANPDLLQATSIAIDSSIYVGTSNGKVIKLLSGQTENWSLAAIDPSLRSVQSIWTDADTPVLVIADATDRRLLIFKKDGKLLQQITSPSFQGPTSAWVDPASDTVFALDGGRILKFTLPRE